LKKVLVMSSVLATLAVTGFAPVFAAESTQVGTQPAQQNLQPGQQGYVGALNNRPSNAFTPASSATTSKGAESPMYVGYWYQFEPSSITVLMRPNNDPSASGTVSTYNFGYYLDNVLPNEWVASWPTQALEAGAVSVRSFGWYCSNYPKYPNVGADVDNTVNSQVFKPGTSTSATNNAISATVDQAVNYDNGGPVEQPGFFKAGTYGTARDSSSYSFYNNAYQNGEDYWANQGKTYQWMLSYYYPGTNIVVGSGSSY